MALSPRLSDGEPRARLSSLDVGRFGTPDAPISRGHHTVILGKGWSGNLVRVRTHGARLPPAVAPVRRGPLDCQRVPLSVERLSPASRSRPVVWRPPLPSGALGGGPTATESASSRRLSPDGGERHGSAFGGQIPPTAHCVFSQSQPIGPAAARLAAVL